MTREEAITVLKAFMENPLFNDEHKQAFNIAIHDIKAYQDWNINNLILVNKDNYEPLEQEPKAKQFAKWVATEIFDDDWKYNKHVFAEIACRKLAKLGIVRKNNDVWELVEPQNREVEE
jgi:predicted metal-dependent HD superfamily phosphohydrolase